MRRARRTVLRIDTFIPSIEYTRDGVMTGAIKGQTSDKADNTTSQTIEQTGSISLHTKGKL